MQQQPWWLQTEWPNQEAGSLVFFSKGEFSDYGVLGSFKVLKDLNQEVLEPIVKGIRERHPEQDQTGLLIPLLVRGGFLEEIHCNEINIGNYGLFVEARN